MANKNRVSICSTFSVFWDYCSVENEWVHVFGLIIGYHKFNIYGGWKTLRRFLLAWPTVSDTKNGKRGSSKSDGDQCTLLLSISQWIWTNCIRLQKLSKIGRKLLCSAKKLRQSKVFFALFLFCSIFNSWIISRT